jgi:uncharacterized membrane protein
MIIMALDHTRDFFHKDGLMGDPLNPDTTNLALYGTRWITHFCAPHFCFFIGSFRLVTKPAQNKKRIKLLFDHPWCMAYPLCKWYDNYKTAHKEKKWLSYL